MKSKRNSTNSFLKFLPKPDERMLIVGMTGSGKTFLAERILRWRDNVIAYDTKGLLDWEGYETITSFGTLKKSKSKYIRYKPPDNLIYKNEEAAEEFFNWVYQRGDTTLYVDEIAQTCYKGFLPYSLHGILSRGRELGVSFVGSTQRPKGIPISLFSESERIACFKLRNYDDGKRIEQSIGVPASNLVKLPKRYFYYANVDITYSKPFTLTDNG